MLFQVWYVSDYKEWTLINQYVYVLIKAFGWHYYKVFEFWSSDTPSLFLFFFEPFTRTMFWIIS